MIVYTSHQLLVVLVLVGAAAAGLAVDHWRRARPDLVDRLERHDRADGAATGSPGAAPAPSESEEARRPLPHFLGSRRDTAPCTGRNDARTAADRGTDRHARATLPPTPVDVNRATELELAQLPGIGPALAARIVSARPFAAVDELRRVRGLRRATLERLRPLLSAASATPPAD